MAPSGSRNAKAVVKGPRGRGPPGLRNPSLDKPHDEAQRALRRRILKKTPVEVRHLILAERLKDLKVDPKGALYEEYLKFPPFFRRALGKRGSINLSDDDQIEEFIKDSSLFRSVLGHRGVTFRDVYCLQTVFPYPASLSLSLGHELAFSAVTHLNLHCGGNPDFLRTLKQWDTALARLEVLRIKYVVYIQENGSDELPWNDPLWIEVLELCQNLRVFLLKTPMPVSTADDWSCRELVPIWARNLPRLQRVYIFHAYDEECDVDDLLWHGSNVLHTRSASGNNLWKTQLVRPKGFGVLSPFRIYIPWTTVRHTDIDVYDSEDCWGPDEEIDTKDDVDSGIGSVDQDCCADHFGRS
ncbi:hypothetical protein CVT26_004124 [Gymnopilus dilepis]|uniref:Uncharacterized protein n=1 Tax=Gymnopilus dilepis TaxID=231916 RepID=A0A409WTQ4_9AGAR|nr:hypothetical protein CVT26_004124 [Gymnopilus dilepis]